MAKTSLSRRPIGVCLMVYAKRAVLTLLLVTATPVFAQSVAMVTDLVGKAAMQGAIGRGSIAILSEIAAEARVQLEAGARFTVVYLASGDEYIFAGPAQVQFRSNEPQVLSGAAPQKHAVPLGKAGKDVAIKLGGVAQAGFIMRGARSTGRIRLLSLANTLTLETIPEFRWQQANGITRYNFRLIDEMDKPLYETVVEDTSLRLPSSVALVEGQRYVWELSARFSDGKQYVSTGDFALAPKELAVRVEALRPAPGTSVAERVLFAAWLEHTELRDEARRHWKTLLAERPDDPTLQALGGEIIHAPRTITDITALLEQYKPDPARIDAIKTIVGREAPAGADAGTLLRFHVERAYAAQKLGMVKRQLADLRRAAELLKGTRDEWTILQDIFLAERTVGNFSNAVRLKDQMLRMSAGQPGRRLNDYANAVELYARMGDLDAAHQALRNAEVIYYKLSRRSRAWERSGDYFIMHIENARGDVLEMQGKHTEAEAAYRKGLAARERWLVVRPQAVQDDRINPSQERLENSVDSAELRLANNLRMQGRLAEAELAVRNVLKRRLSRLGRHAPATAVAIGQFARLLNEQGRFRDAETMAREAINIHKAVGSAPASYVYVAARRAFAAALAMQGRWTEALPVFREMSAEIARDPLLAQGGRGDYNWAIALVKTGQPHKAIPMLEAGLRRWIERLGPSHYEVAERRGLLAVALAESGQRQRALSEYQEALKVLLARVSSGTDEDGGGTAKAWRLSLILEGYIKLLHQIRNELGQGAGFDAAAEAFRVADALRGQSTQRAFAASSARAAAGNPALAELIRKEQDTKQLIAVLYGTLLRLLDAPADQQLPQVVAQMRARIQEFENEQRQLSAELERRFPAYVDLISPQPATIDETRAALREGEVLLSLLTTEDRTYVWAIPKSGVVAFHAAPLGDKAAEDIVAGLRKSLDVGRVALEAVPDFDVAAAHRLYAELLKPVESTWKGAHTLMVVANGALAQLPFSVLPTEAVVLTGEQGQRFSRYQSVPWLIKKIALAQLPAVNTLTTLRRLPAGSTSRLAFAGFGDPQFGPQVAVAAAPERLTLRMRSAALPEGNAENWMPYSRLAPLPDTREEILAIAAALKADAQRDVFLGSDASRQNVGATGLSTRRIVAFATHALIAGDFPNLDQPALALAAPSGSAEEGLLTLGDILAMKLDADWVVLSACNTAAGDGQGAEAISGLGRGFFYAGSRALLVTHWAVETHSARDLVTILFERYAGRNVSRAEALREASLAVMEKTAPAEGGLPAFSYAHPLFWAPYALVGDGAR